MKCPSCERRNSIQAAFCSGCGAALEPPPTPETPSELGVGPESWRWIVIWSIVVLAIVGALCIYAFQPDGQFRVGRPPGASGSPIAPANAANSTP
jgi:hypothetical protein